MKADQPPAGQKQRHVQYDGQNAHRQRRDQGVDHLGRAGDAAHGYLIGCEEPVEGQGEQQGTRRDHGVAFQGFPDHTVSPVSSSRPICRSSVSSWRSKAPAAGTARTR